jgi:hypothetical protein
VSHDWKVWAFVAGAVLFAATFLPAEFIAVFNKKPGDTATEHVRKFPMWLRVIIGVVPLGLGIWLFPHFVFGIWG